MTKHYKGEITIYVDAWGENEEEAIESYFSDLRKKGEDAEVLESDLDCVDVDDSDDYAYYEGIEFDNWRERMND